MSPVSRYCSLSEECERTFRPTLRPGSVAKVLTVHRSSPRRNLTGKKHFSICTNAYLRVEWHVIACKEMGQSEDATKSQVDLEVVNRDPKIWELGTVRIRSRIYGMKQASRDVPSQRLNSRESDCLGIILKALVDRTSKNWLRIEYRNLVSGDMYLAVDSAPCSVGTRRVLVLKSIRLHGLTAFAFASDCSFWWFSYTQSFRPFRFLAISIA